MFSISIIKTFNRTTYSFSFKYSTICQKSYYSSSKMTIPSYGVWSATPTIFTAQRTGSSPHGILTFTDSTSTYISTTADINVKSTTTDTRLVYWNNAAFTNPITSQLAELKPGFTSLASAPTGTSGTRLDLLRGGLETLSSGQVLETSVKGEGNDIVDDLTTIFNNAITEKATVYIWGSQYVDNGSVAGIHDIHMNQGDSGSFTSDNGTWQDGSFILHFPDGHYEAVFLAFAEQYTQTDDGGQPITTASTFAQLLNSPAPASDSKTNAGKSGHGHGHGHPRHHSRHKKHAKRHGDSYEESPMKVAWGASKPSHVVLEDADQKREMKGWSLVDGQGKERKISEKEAEGIREGRQVDFPDVGLQSAGGVVYLRDAGGKTVADMVYSKFC